MAISAKDIQRLRQEAGVGMMDAKKALEETDGDFDAAKKLLRERGLAKMSERSDRANSQGAVAVGRAGKAASVAQLKCETDFVAKSPEFVTLLQKIADVVAAEGEGAASRFSDDIDSMRISLKENIELGEIVRFDPPAGAVVDTYLHVQSDRGVNATMIEVAPPASGGSSPLDEVAHEIALHIAFARPRYLNREAVPADVVADERSTLEQITRNEGKPEAALPKIVEGRIGGFFKTVCLVEQEWAKDNKKTITDLLAGATATRFAQVEVGR